jgi:hypothetical protein
MNEQESKQLELYVKSLKDTIELSMTRLEDRWNAWPINANEIEIHEVIGAIIARQISLAKSFADNPQLWNNDLAPLFLRAMTENYITLNWILQEPLDRVRKFIEYGIGNEKLQIEKRKLILEEQGEDPDEDEAEMIESRSQWIDFHRYSFLTTVDVGSWSGISTRQMAIDSGCKDFYDLVYNPFSNCTHSSWNHIGKYNVKMSENPMHKFLRLPYVHKGEIESFYANLSIKYLSMVFNSFEEKYFPEVEDESIRDFYYSKLEKAFKLNKYQ